MSTESSFTSSESSRLLRGASELGIELDAGQIAQFARFGELLQEWNARLNLTRIPRAEFVPLHFLDSLILAKSVDLFAARSLIDVGTGAGFPGIPLKIAFPNLAVTLLDSTRKRLTFLDHIIVELGFEGISTCHARAEDAGRLLELRELFDIAAARAVARLGTLAELLLPLVRVDGAVVAMKSAEIEEELSEAQSAVRILGGRIERVDSIPIPETDVLRRLVILHKERPTPARYPRSSAQVKAKRL